MPVRPVVKLLFLLALIAPCVGAAQTADPRIVPFECPAHPVMDSGCETSPGWIVDLHDGAEPLLSSAHGVPPRFYCRRVERALQQAMTTELAQLRWEDRVVVQNLALRVLLSKGCADPVQGARAPRGTAPRKLAARVVRRMALPASELRRIGSKPARDLDRFVPGRAGWRDLEANQPELVHDAMERFTRRFRPVRAGSTRAIFSQLVALDTELRPAVTPLVGRVELRAGTADDAPACVAKLVPSRLRCTVGRLQAVRSPTPDHKHIRSIFMSFALDRVTCGECHGKSSPRARGDDALFGDLPLLRGAKARPHLAARRSAFEAGAAKLGPEVRRWLREP